VDSTGKLEMLRSIGADHVIDYTREDFTKNGETYDVVFDVVGKNSFSRCLRALKQSGRYLLANPRLSTIFRGMWISRTSSKKVITSFATRKPEDFIFLKELVEAWKLKTVIDRRYPLEQTADAHRYVETGHKTGNVVITVAHHS
jgi:NADPH:quinone reductase-like Zn-dependent oxidoreductase